MWGAGSPLGALHSSPSHHLYLDLSLLQKKGPVWVSSSLETGGTVRWLTQAWQFQILQKYLGVMGMVLAKLLPHTKAELHRSASLPPSCLSGKLWGLCSSWSTMHILSPGLSSHHQGYSGAGTDLPARSPCTLSA